MVRRRGGAGMTTALAGRLTRHPASSRPAMTATASGAATGQLPVPVPGSGRAGTADPPARCDQCIGAAAAGFALVETADDECRAGRYRPPTPGSPPAARRHPERMPTMHRWRTRPGTHRLAPRRPRYRTGSRRRPCARNVVVVFMLRWLGRFRVNRGIAGFSATSCFERRPDRMAGYPVTRCTAGFGLLPSVRSCPPARDRTRSGILAAP